MKFNKTGVILPLLFGIFIGLTGIVCADQPVPAVPETQTLSTVTTADVVGLALETDTGTWTLTNNPNNLYTYVVDTGTMGIFGNPDPNFPNDWIQRLASAGGSVDYVTVPGGIEVFSISIPESQLNELIPGLPETNKELGEFMTSDGPTTITGQGLHNGALYPGQVQYTTAYDANIVAQAGHTVFTKSMNIDTRNKVISQSNLNSKTTLTFAATADGGNVIGSENLMIDGAGMNTTASDRMLCPFASQPIDQIPAYCNIVQAGSKYDLTIGSVTTNANDRFVGNDATNPVVLNYDINVRPYGTSQGQIPAMGSAMAYVKAHIQEARTNTSKAEDIVYNEQSSAQGTITAFTKVIAYQSGKSLL
jgi:hypothetical protein